MPFEERVYRTQNKNDGQLKFTVIIEESDCEIVMDPLIDLETAFSFAEKALFDIREDIKTIIKLNPEFYTSHKPITIDDTDLNKLKDPNLIKRMINASTIALVGPMACVAGITSEYLVKALQKQFHPKNIICENGGDIYMDGNSDKTISIYAGSSVLSNKLALKIKKEDLPLSICTSSGTVGHSFSYGCADAVVVVCKDSALADACATYLANQIQSVDDIQATLDCGLNIKGIESIIIIKDDKIGFTKNTELVRI